MEIRINELDLTRAGIISVQRDLSPAETTWQADYTLGDVMYRVTGSAFHGRPRGRDADILLALQTLFFRAGCPETNALELSASQLLSTSGHARNGQNGEE
nr:replication initiator protein A [Deinococcus sp. Leaf326]